MKLPRTTLAFFCAVPFWSMVMGVTTSVPEENAGAARMIGSTIEIEPKTVSVGTEQWSVAVVKCQSFNDVATTPRAMTQVYGPSAPGGSGDPPVFKIVTRKIGNGDEMFNVPSLVKGWAYCRLHKDPKQQARKDQLLAAKARKEAFLKEAAENLGPVQAEIDKASKEISDLEKAIKDAEIVRIFVGEPDLTDRVPWWPIIVTHYIDGGASGTDLLVQLTPQDENTQTLRLYLPVGTGASARYRDENGDQEMSMKPGEYMEFKISNAKISLEKPPAPVPDNELKTFVGKATEVFKKATGLTANEGSPPFAK